MAAHEINTRFKLEGEQEYKKAMTDAANAIKVLNSEQKLAAAEFENTGDRQQYAATQARILKEQIANQQKAVEAAEAAVKKLTDNGVDPSSKAMQTWKTKLNNARTAMFSMQTRLQSVEGELGDQTTAFGDAQSAGGDYQGQLEKIGKGFDINNTITAIDNITDKIANAAKAAARAAKAIWDMGADAGDWADELLTASSQMGVDVETLQSWRYASRFIDTSVDDISRSWQDLTKRIKDGDVEYLGYLAEMGVASMNTDGTMRESQDIFWDMIDVLHNMEDPAQRAAAATKLFGNDWRNLNPLIEAGSEAYKDLAEEGRETAVVSEENVQALGAMDDQMEKTQAAFDKLKYDALAAMAPTFEKIAAAMETAITSLDKFLESAEGQEMLASLNESLSGIIDAFIGENGEGFSSLVETAKGALSGLNDALKWIADNKDGLVVAIEAIAAAFAALKVSSTVLEFVKLFQGAKGLFNLGGKGGNPTTPTNTPTNPTDPDTPRVLSPVKPKKTPTTPTTPTAPTPTTPTAPAAPQLSEIEILASDAALAADMAAAAAIDTAAAAEAAAGGFTLFSQEALSGAAFYGSSEAAALAGMSGEIGLSGVIAAASPFVAMLAEGLLLKLDYDKWYEQWVASGNAKYDYDENADYWANAEDAWSRAESDELFSIIDVLGEAATIMGGYNGHNEQDLVAAVREKFGEDTDLYKTISEYAKYIPRGESLMNTLNAILEGDPSSQSLVFDFLQMTEGGFNRLTEMGLEAEEQARTAGEGVADGMAEGIEGESGTVVDAVAAMSQNIIDAATSALDEHSPSKVFDTIGRNAAIGLANGIYAGGNSAILAALWLAKSVENIVRSALQIHSPSAVFDDLGGFVGEGFAEGISGSADNVSRAVDKMVSATMRRPVMSIGGYSVSPVTGARAGSGAGAAGAADMVNVTLVLDEEVLGSVMAPIVNDRIGAKIQATRR